jgi:aspartate kinase
VTDVMDELVKAVGGAEWSLDDAIGRVSIVGAGMRTSPGVAATMFETLADEGINIEMISTSTIRLSCVVRTADVERAVQALHAAYGLEEARS